MAAASCVRPFSLASGSILSRLDATGLRKISPSRVSLSGCASGLPCQDFCAISHGLSTLAFVSSYHNRRLPRIAALAADPFDLDQDVPLESTEPIEQLDLEPNPDFQQRPITPQGTKLYVGNIPWSVDSQQLAQIFQDIGSVEMVEVICDRETGRSRGFAFVTMTTEQDAHTAIEKLDGAEYGGRRLRVNLPERTRTGGPPSPRSGGGYDSPCKLFVGNLPWSVDEGILEQIFSKHGNVQEARIVYDRETGRSRGFGFVTLSSETEVNDAITILDGSNVDGRFIRVNLASDRPASRF